MSTAQAAVFRVKLERKDSSHPWGFRLQGGADFSTALSIQKVTAGTVAEGQLCAGDAVLQINGVNTDSMEHEEAKMAIIRSGNEILFTLQRGSVTVWKPEVTPLSELRPDEAVDPNALPGEPPLMQRTSLAANKQASLHIGSAHNRAAAPFRPGGASYQPPSDQQPATANTEAAAPNPSYQSATPNQGLQSDVPNPSYQPAEPNPSYQSATPNQGLQSDMPNPSYQPTTAYPSYHSATPNQDYAGYEPSANQSPGAGVVSQLQSMQLQPHGGTDEESGIDYAPQFTPSGQQHDISSSRSMRMLQHSIGGGGNTAPVHQRPTGFRSVRPPRAPGGGTGPTSAPNAPVCQECKGCKKIISVNNRMPNTSGVFMKIKNSFYHPECFKCESCGTNLRQKGYFFIDNQVLCETHARIKTRPPGPGMVAVVTDVPDDYE